MKIIYEEFLKIPKNEKIRDKVMMTRILLSVVIMVLCLGAMGFTAYAYFSCNITSAVTTIQSARYELNVAVTDVTPVEHVVEGAAVTVEEKTAVEITPNEEGYYIFENVATEEKLEVKDRVYEFVLTKPKTSTATVGYGKFEVLTDVNEDGSRQRYYTTPIGAYEKEGKTVKNEEYKLQLHVPANKTIKVKVIAEWGTCAREPVQIDEVTQIPTLIPDFKDSKYIHISFDDVSHSLLRLKNESYTSIYDEPFFAWLKTLHDTYGAKFSLYAYVNVLEQVPDKYQADFLEAKDWLKIGLHAEDVASNYGDVNLTHDEGVAIWKCFAENVFRITGTYESIDRMPKLEGSAGSKEALQGMKDAVSETRDEYGALGFLADNVQADGNSETTQLQGVYYLNAEKDADAITTLFAEDFYIDRFDATTTVVETNSDESLNGFVFVSTDIVFGELNADPLKRQEQYEAATSMHSCIALLHEGQIYDENGFITDAEGNTELLKNQVEELCKFANGEGIKFNYPQTRDFAAIQALKDAEKAAKEAAAKEAAEKAAQEVVERATTEQKNATQEKTDTQSEKTGTQSGTQTETQSEIPTDTSSGIDSDTKSE